MIIFKQYMIFMALLFAAIPLGLAQLDYNETGFSDGTYDSDTTGFFNTALDATVVSVNSQEQGITNAKQPALVSNLDNAGLKEIIILDSDSVVIMNRTIDSIRIIDSVNIGSPTDFYSNMIVFDVDGDGFFEILVANPFSGFIHILQYNGTDFIEENNVNISRLSRFNDNGISTTTSSDTMIKCGAVESCLIAYTSGIDITSGTATRTVHAAFFNSTNASDAITIDSETGLVGRCFPKIKQIQFADYDGDGENEYVFSAVDIDSANNGDEEIEIYRINASVDGTIEEAQATINNVDHFVGNDQNDCRTDLAGNLFTSPLVFESGDGGDIETIIASQVDPDEFAIYIIEGAAITHAKRFPEIADADGTILSNIFTADAFEDSDTEIEFCVLGQEADDNRLNVLCGSDTSTFALTLKNNVQWFLDDYTEIFEFNISNAADDWHIVTHSVAFSTADRETHNTDEILTSFGVLDLTHDSLTPFLNPCKTISLIPPFATADCKLEVLFDTQETDGASIPVDYESIGRVDIIHTTPTQVIYLDDLFANSPVAEFCDQPNAIIDACTIVTINPCLDSTWKVNTSLTITVTPLEPDSGEEVSARVILYEDDPNEQDTFFTANASSGFTRSFNSPVDFEVNKTISDGNLQIQIRGSGNEQIRSLNLPFSVSNSGLIKGDCETILDKGATRVAGVGQSCTETADCQGNLVCSFTGICFDPDDDATLLTDSPENAITRALKNLQEISGLAGTSLWLIFMIALTAGLWFEGAKMRFGATTVLGAIAVTNLLMIILGSRLGILSSNLIVIITILGILIIAVFLGKFLTGLRSEAM